LADWNVQLAQRRTHCTCRGATLLIELSFMLDVIGLRLCCIRWYPGRARVAHENHIPATLKRRDEILPGKGLAVGGAQNRQQGKKDVQSMANCCSE
jgi:hypothetical protein